MQISLSRIAMLNCAVNYLRAIERIYVDTRGADTRRIAVRDFPVGLAEEMDCLVKELIADYESLGTSAGNPVE